MKWATYWWGVQFLAENKAEEELLKKLKQLLGDRTPHSYEEGGAYLLETKNMARDCDFTMPELRQAKIMLEINR